jgi:hypothetical protein
MLEASDDKISQAQAHLDRLEANKAAHKARVVALEQCLLSVGFSGLVARVAGSADLNAAQAVQVLYAEIDKIMEAWGCLVILVHHPKRNSVGSAGSVQIENSAYAVWHQRFIKAENRIECDVFAMKDGKDDFTVAYEVDWSSGPPVVIDTDNQARAQSAGYLRLANALRQVPNDATINIVALAALIEPDPAKQEAVREVISLDLRKRDKTCRKFLYPFGSFGPDDTLPHPRPGYSWLR